MNPTINIPTLASALVLATLTSLHGQVAAPAPTTAPAPEALQLSPFVISTSTDTGYAATQTLAGTRLRTELKDTPVSLSVLTEDFLNDIAATDVQSVVDFLPNTAMFTLAGGDDTGNSAKRGDTLSIRGFKTASATRDFFQSIGFTDRYNTDRFTFSRGPNSLLFGIGNPGGAVHVSTNRAELGRNRGSLSYQWDNYDSHRLTLDQNYVLIPKRLALRGDLLFQDSHGFREPTFDKKTGAYLTTTWRPFGHERTQVRLNYEYGKVNRNAARPWAPFDLHSTWINAGTPLYDNRTQARPSNVPSRTNPYVLAEDYFVSIVGQDTIPTFRTTRGTGYLSYVRSAGQIANGIEQTTSSITRDFVALNPLDILSRHFGGDQTRLNTWLNGLGANRAIVDQWQGKTVTVPMETFFSGNHDHFIRTFRNVSPYIEHQFTKDFFVEVAANYEKARIDNLTMLRSSDYGIQYDPNLYLPGGVPNPYAGMPYVGTLAFPTLDRSEEENHEYRATATYRFDLRRFSALKYLDLGRHSVSALVNRFDNEGLAQQDRPAVIEWAGQPIERLLAAGVRATTANVRGRYYLLPDTVPYIPEPWVPLKGEGTVGRSEWINFNGVLDKMRVDSIAVGTQSFFFRDRLVVTAGVRSDRLKQYTTTQRNVAAANARPAEGIYFNEVDMPSTLSTLALRTERKWNNRTTGAVLHLTSFLSAFYNTGTNVSGGDDVFNIFLEPVSANNGKGVDYGLKFQFFGNKLVGSITQFETTQINTWVNSPAVAFGRGALGTSLLPILERADPAERARRDTVLEAWMPIYDSQTTGHELEIVWNPTRNLRLRGTYATQENVVSRFGEDMDAYIAANRGTWEAFINANYDPSFPGPANPNAPTAEERRKMDADVVRQNLQLIDAEMPIKRGINGAPTLGLPEYSVSFAGTYDFGRTTFLRGWSIGTTVRYRGSSTVAFEQDANGVLNRTNSLRTPGARDWDMHVSYRRKLWNDRIDWRVQANIRNLLDDDDPVYLTGLWDRTAQAFMYTRNQMKEPRSLVLTTTFGW